MISLAPPEQSRRVHLRVRSMVIGPGALSQTRVRRVTVTLGAVGSAGFKMGRKYKAEMCMCVCALQVGEREHRQKSNQSIKVETEMQVADSSRLVLMAL